MAKKTDVKPFWGEQDAQQGRLANEQEYQDFPALLVVKDQSEAKKKGLAQAGEIWSAPLQMTLGKVEIKGQEAKWAEPVSLQLLAFVNEWLEWPERFSPGDDPVFRTFDRDEAEAEYGEDAFRHHHLRCGCLVMGQPHILSFRGWDSPVGRDFYREVVFKPKMWEGQFYHNVPIQAQRWNLTTRWNEKNDNFSPHLSFASLVAEEDYRAALVMVDALQDRIKNVNVASNPVKNIETEKVEAKQEKLPF